MSDTSLTASTLIAASDNATSPPNIQGPASSLADSTLLELTANGELILACGSANAETETPAQFDPARVHALAR